MKKKELLTRIRMLEDRLDRLEKRLNEIPPTPVYPDPLPTTPVYPDPLPTIPAKPWWEPPYKITCNTEKPYRIIWQ